MAAEGVAAMNIFGEEGMSGGGHGERVWLKLEEGATVGLGEVRDTGRSEKMWKIELYASISLIIRFK